MPPKTQVDPANIRSTRGHAENGRDHPLLRRALKREAGKRLQYLGAKLRLRLNEFLAQIPQAKEPPALLGQAAIPVGTDELQPAIGKRLPIRFSARQRFRLALQ